MTANTPGTTTPGTGGHGGHGLGGFVVATSVQEPWNLANLQLPATRLDLQWQEAVFCKAAGGRLTTDDAPCTADVGAALGVVARAAEEIPDDVMRTAPLSSNIS